MSSTSGGYTPVLAYATSSSGPSDATTTANAAWLASSIRSTRGQSSRSPASVLSTKKLGNATANVTTSSSGSLSAEYTICSGRPAQTPV